jgi:hypothetical protein
MLGDDWSTYTKFIADQANHSLWLQTKKLKLIPPFNESKQKTLGEDLTPWVMEVSATHAAKLLAAPRYGCTPAFTVVVKQNNPAGQAQDEQDPGVQPLLCKYAEAFGPPSMATICRELMPEANLSRSE